MLYWGINLCKGYSQLVLSMVFAKVESSVTSALKNSLFSLIKKFSQTESQFKLYKLEKFQSYLYFVSVVLDPGHQEGEERELFNPGSH